MSTRRSFLRCGARSVGGLVLASVSPWREAHGAGQTDFRRWGPFLCRADFPLSGYEGLSAELVALERELIRTLAVPASEVPIELYLFANQQSHRAFLSDRFPRIPYRRALFVKSDGVGRVFAYRHAEMATDVRHECTHALLHAGQPMVPLWLDEGLAEYFEVPQPQRAYHNPHLGSLRWNLRLGYFPSLRSLEDRADLSEMRGLEYRFSWAWAHFMLHGPRVAHRELVQFLSDIRRGVPPGRLSDRLSRAVPNVERRLVAHFKYWRQR